jgi:carotenoid 1,2-hydratase
VGSVFSPYYAAARKRGPTSAENHCAINVALYGRKKRWAMTERGERTISRTNTEFNTGSSRMRWLSDELVIDLNEQCAPIPFPLRGTVRIQPGQLHNGNVMLDAHGRHGWRAVAPAARITVTMTQPSLAWSGFAYHDMNWGDEPLEKAFKNWTWLRAKTASGTQVLYEIERRDGTRKSFGQRFANGIATDRQTLPVHELKKGLWRMPRTVQSECPPHLVATLEDAPFYTRNHVRIGIDGETCNAFHESLSLDRFTNPIVQRMLPFRMPRFA